jgi:hypothetical protein
MKDIYNIYEGLLKGQDSHLSMSDDDVKDILKLGTYIKIRTVRGCNESNAGMFNAQGLKQLTKDLSYIDDRIERGIFDKRNKLKMFANWISNLTVDQLNIGYKIDPSDDEWRKQFIDCLNIMCGAAGIFNNPFYTNVSTSSTKVTGKDTFEIMVYRLDKYTPGIKFVFDIVK